jgi:hypothetical protein
MESESRPPTARRAFLERLSLRLPWGVVAPIVLLAAALATVAWLDLSSGGDAKPKPLLGVSGTPVRSAYLAPTATPFGPQPTAKAKPTSAPGPNLLKGTSAERDATRRADLLLLLAAAQKYKAESNGYPDTHNYVQTVCVYKDLDLGCKLRGAFGGDLPEDPRGNQNGYWIQSDGQTIKIYASLEGGIDDAAKCPTTDAELQKHGNLICVTGG